MPGHIFLLRGDIRYLACDATLLPCDFRARADLFLPDDRRGEDCWPAPTADFTALECRVLAVPEWHWDKRLVWLVNVGYESRSGQTQEEFYRQSIGESLQEVFRSFSSPYKPQHRRQMPLVAMPFLGGRRGMPMVESGQLLRSLLKYLDEALGRITHEVDVALVLFDTRTLAAAQSERKKSTSQTWKELSREDCDRATRLADQAAAGNLALFMGAGTGVGAGLPTWNELLGKLADAGNIKDPLRKSLLDSRRDVRDQASFLQEHLGGPQGLQNQVVSVIRESGERYSLTHALLASLPAREAITTNYDQLFETAWGHASAASTSVIPHQIRPEAHRWLLKLHGCITQPDSIVLTRESYIRYSHQYAALEGILQAVLLTRHLLFVGFSLRDDNFIRILDAVRRVVRPLTATGETREPFGSALMMGKDKVMQDLYQTELHWVSQSDQEELAMTGKDFQQPGRKLEIFLDYLLSRTGAASYMLGDDFESILSEDEKRLREALRPLADFARTPTAFSPARARVKSFLADFGG